MARDKQLIVRLEGDIREKFKQLCQSHGLEMSSFVYSLICQFVDGSIPIENFAQSTASGLDSEVIADLKKSVLADLAPIIQSEVEKAIAGLGGSGENFSQNTAAENVTNWLQKPETSGEADPFNWDDFLIPGQEYKQQELVDFSGVAKSSISTILSGKNTKPINPILKDLLTLIQSGKLIKTEGGKWTIK